MSSIPIFLANNQSHPTPAHFQQLIVVNSTKYGIYSNWTNVEFTTGVNATGTLLPAWVESNATNSSTHTTVWVRLNRSIDPSSKIEIYMNIMPSNVMSANGTTGEAPTLSPRYAQYDNGNLVFDSYDNFIGNDSGSGIGTIDSEVSSGSNNTGWRIDNGLTFGQLGDGVSSVIYLSNLTINQTDYQDLNKTVDVPWEPSSQGYSVCEGGGWGCYTQNYPTGSGGFVGSGSFVFDSGVMRADSCETASIGSCSSSFYTFNGTSEIQHVFDSTINENSHYYTFLPPLSFSLYGDRFYLQNGYSGYNTSYGVGAPLNDTTSLHNSTDVFAMTSDPHCWGCTTSYPAFLNNTATIHWIRVRLTPPNAVMPSVSFGVPVAISYSTPVVVRNQTASIAVNLTTNNMAKPPYTFTINLANTLTNQVIQTVTVTTNATSYTQNFTLGSTDMANFPEVVNVVVTDSASHTVASSYSSPLVLFKTLPVSLSAYGNVTSMDQGGSGTWIVNSSEVSGPYDLNASVYSSTGALITRINQTYQQGQSFITIPIPANLTAGIYTLNVTLNEWNNSYDNSYVGSGTNSTFFTVNPRMVAGLPNANAAVVAKGSNATLYANVSGGTSPYLNYAWFYGSDPNCTTDLQEPWNWTLNGGTKDINYAENASDSFSIRINSTTYACYAVQDSTGTWAISNTTSVDLYHPNVTLIIYNNQTVPTAADFQQMVRINSTDPIFQNLSYDGGNVRFFSGDTELYSWRENATLFWIRLPGEIGPGSTMGVNMTNGVWGQGMPRASARGQELTPL